MITQFSKTNIQENAKTRISNKLGSYKLPLGLTAIMVIATLLIPINYAYAETPRETFDAAKLKAEADFADAIIEAKSKLQTIQSDPTVNAEELSEARAQYKITVAEAKQLRDLQIENARKAYQNSLESTIATSPQENKIRYLAAIESAKTTFEQTLHDAKQRLDERLAEIRGDGDLEDKAKADYKRLVADAKKAYNEAIVSAKTQFKV